MTKMSGELFEYFIFRFSDLYNTPAKKLSANNHKNRTAELPDTRKVSCLHTMSGELQLARLPVNLITEV